MVKGCRFCLEKQPRQKEPLTTTELPLRPFQQVAADLSQHNGQKYLVVFDYYSRYFEICHLPLITSEVVIGRMNNIFAHHGVPETVVTDDGRQFTASEFQRLSDQGDSRSGQVSYRGSPTSGDSRTRPPPRTSHRRIGRQKGRSRKPRRSCSRRTPFWLYSPTGQHRQHQPESAR